MDDSIQVPTFFVGLATSEAQELIYVDLAKLSGVSVPPASERIYSLSFTHNGDRWDATVGESLKGKKKVTTGRGRTMKEHWTPVSDQAIVLAIFDSTTYIVWTDSGHSARRASSWSNPFYAGKPAAVKYFAI